MQKRKYICRILAVLWMIVIFCFSARPAEVSTEDSNRVGELIGNIVIPDFENWSEERQLEFAQKIDHPVRKTAHATEYAILGFLLLSSYADEEKRKRNMIGVAWLAGTLYAASDEFHQLFVAGRSGQISDVMLDSTGVMIGVLLGTLFFQIVKSNRGREEK